tara:strand:- start:523 stop:729 length:207 start_codon:yes stop_codon:yes gene_type:complete
MKAKEIRELSIAELEKQIRDLRDQSLDLRLKKQTGQLENTAEVTKIRKTIARLETVRTEKLSADAKSA